MSKVAVIGGGGRLGLRLSLLAANKGHRVFIVDIDEERLNEIKNGNLPFVEPGAELYLEQALKNHALVLNLENNNVSESNVVIITIGTPVDSNLNPSLEPVAGIIFDLSEYFKKGQLIVFRNTISPQVAQRIKTLIEDKTNLKVGKDIYLAFAPEFTRDNNTIHDLLKVPQPVGAFDEKSFEAAETFFRTITKGKISHLTPEEVLLAKLMTNMFLYIKSACANEFYLIAESFGASIHKIIDAVGKENNILNPNPNAAGPGMHKEGWFLVDRVPFGDLVTTAFKINESIPSYIVQKLEGQKVNKVVILGMTNKPDSDDPRSSLSYKLRKALFYKDYNVACYDPYLPEYSDSSVLAGADALILMTRHAAFKDLEKIKSLVKNNNCLIFDISGFWQELRDVTKSGFHYLYYAK